VAVKFISKYDFSPGEIWVCKDPAGIKFYPGVTVYRMFFVLKFEGGRKLPRFKTEGGIIVRFNREFHKTWDLNLRRATPEEEAEFLLEAF
jgi:hypothetical protein